MNENLFFNADVAKVQKVDSDIIIEFTDSKVYIFFDAERIWLDFTNSDDQNGYFKEFIQDFFPYVRIK